MVQIAQAELKKRASAFTHSQVAINMHYDILRKVFKGAETGYWSWTAGSGPRLKKLLHNFAHHEITDPYNFEEIYKEATKRLSLPHEQKGHLQRCDTPGAMKKGFQDSPTQCGSGGGKVCTNWSTSRLLQINLPH
jgi:hypothetical protein